VGADLTCYRRPSYRGGQIGGVNQTRPPTTIQWALKGEESVAFGRPSWFGVPAEWRPIGHGGLLALSVQIKIDAWPGGGEQMEMRAKLKMKIKLKIKSAAKKGRTCSVCVF